MSTPFTASVGDFLDGTQAAFDSGKRCSREIAAAPRRLACHTRLKQRKVAPVSSQ
jgi:hypothetical protein